MSIELYLLAVGALVAGLVAVLLLTSSLASASAALGVLLVTAVLVPFQTSGGFNACTAIVPVLCALGLGRRLVRRQPVGMAGSAVVIALMTFMLIAVLAFIVGQYPWFTTSPAPMRAQLGGLGLFVFSAGLVLYVGYELRSIRELERLTWLFVVLGAGAIVTSIVGRLNVGVGPIRLVDAFSIGSVFWTWIVAITFSQALFNERLSPVMRGLLLAVGLAAVLRGVVFAFSWTSGWLPPMAVLGVLGLLRFPRLTISVGALALVPILIYGQSVYQSYAHGESYSAMTRGEAAVVMWRMIQHSPWIGFGPANYYHYTLMFPILGWWVRFNSHNNYIDLVAQTGFVGLFAFLWLSWEFFRLARWLSRRVSAGFERAYAVGAMAGLVGTLLSGFLADWIVPFAYNIGLAGFRSSLLFWFFMGGLLAMRRLLAHEAHAQPAVPIAAPIAPRPAPSFGNPFKPASTMPYRGKL